MLLKFHREKHTDSNKTIQPYSFEFWANANQIASIGFRYRGDFECIQLCYNNNATVSLCPEKHPLESVEELVKLINKAKKES